jgi:hypothetical protein
MDWINNIRICESIRSIPSGVMNVFIQEDVQMRFKNRQITNVKKVFFLLFYFSDMIIISISKKNIAILELPVQPS